MLWNTNLYTQMFQIPNKAYFCIFQSFLGRFLAILKGGIAQELIISPIIDLIFNFEHIKVKARHSDVNYPKSGLFFPFVGLFDNFLAIVKRVWLENLSFLLLFTQNSIMTKSRHSDVENPKIRLDFYIFCPFLAIFNHFGVIFWGGRGL